MYSPTITIVSCITYLNSGISHGFPPFFLETKPQRVIATSQLVWETPMVRAVLAGACGGAAQQLMPPEVCSAKAEVDKKTDVVAVAM